MLPCFTLYHTKLPINIECHFKRKGLYSFIGMWFIVSNAAYNQIKENSVKCQSDFLKNDCTCSKLFN